MLMSEHEQEHCFIAVPYGKDEREHALLTGWVEALMMPVIAELGLTPIIAASTPAPTAITLEIRTHLALDRLAIFDLGGLGPTDPPNPNVMYELGIRHAFELPAVVLAWDTQVLPFDISEQRIIVKDRHFGTLEWHKQQLKMFSEAALSGEYFRPMRPVAYAQLLSEVVDTSKDDVLKLLNEEVKDIRRIVTSLLNLEQKREARARQVDRNLIPLPPSLRGLIDFDAGGTPLPLRTMGIPGTHSESE
jgi:hypothetical protein